MHCYKLYLICLNGFKSINLINKTLLNKSMEINKFIAVGTNGMYQKKMQFKEIPKLFRTKSHDVRLLNILYLHPFADFFFFIFNDYLRNHYAIKIS